MPLSPKTKRSKASETSAAQRRVLDENHAKAKAAEAAAKRQEEEVFEKPIKSFIERMSKLIEEVLIRCRTVPMDYFLFQYLDYALNCLSSPIHDTKISNWPHILKWASTLLFYGANTVYDVIRGEGW